jgi:hypothetical protein
MTWKYSNSDHFGIPMANGAGSSGGACEHAIHLVSRDESVQLNHYWFLSVEQD